MPCPNCNATLQNLGIDQPGRRVFWCPNCGTLKWERFLHNGKTAIDTDVLVEIDTPKVTARLNAGKDDEFRRWEEDYYARHARCVGNA